MERRGAACHLEWSPIIGLCLRQLHIYRWIIRFKKGQRTNVSNLVQMCVNNGIKHPGTMTLGEAETGKAAMVKKPRADGQFPPTPFVQ